MVKPAKNDVAYHIILKQLLWLLTKISIIGQ